MLSLQRSADTSIPRTIRIRRKDVIPTVVEVKVKLAREYYGPYEILNMDATRL